MTQLKSLIAESIFKRANETTASQQMAEIKMIKRDPMPQFNIKINEDRYKPTKQLQKPWKTKETKDFEKTKEALDRDMTLLQERQKLILLAHKSPFCWKTVLEYKHNDLADDEENEKKIYRAESSRGQGG